MIGKTILRWLLSISLIIAIFITIALTPLGLKLGLFIADLVVPGTISYKEASGIITGPIKITQFKYTSDKEKISIDTLDLDWDPLRLLSKKIIIKHFVAHNVKITSPFGQSSGGFPIPASVEIGNAEIHELYVGTTPNEFPIYIKKIQLKAQINSQRTYLKSFVDMKKPFVLNTFLNVSGHPDNYSIEAHTKSPKLIWHLYGSGNTKGMTLKLNEGKTLDGSLSFNAAFRWAKNLAWDIQLNGKHLNFRDLNENWPTQFSIALSTQGHMQNNQPRYNVVTQITAPGTNIHINASHKNQLTINWNATINQLDYLYRPYKGSINSKGMWKADTFSFNINGKNINVPSIQLNAFSLQGKGSQQSHTIQGSVTKNNETINFIMQGGLHNQTWTGQLKKLTLISTQFWNWQLIKPTNLTLSNNRVSIENLCVKSGKEGNFCIHGNWDSRSRWQLKGDAQNFNSAVLLHFLFPKLTLTSTASLHLTAAGKGKKFDAVKANILLQNGILHYQLNGTYLDTPVQQGKINITFQKNDLSASTQLLLSKGNLLNSSITIPDFSINKSLSSQSIKGSLKFIFSDLTPFNKLLKDIAKPSGTLTADLTIKGTIKSPDIRGRVLFKNGSIEAPKYGIVFNKININISSFSANTIEYKIIAYSKNQPIHVEGVTRATPEGIKTTAKIKAQNAMLMNNSEYIVYASPDLEINILNYNIDVTGKIDIPQAIIQPHEITNIAKLPNNEVIYTAGDPESKQTTWKISANIKIKLGKNVTVNTGGFEATVNGEAVVRGQPKKTTLADGRIDIIKGKYTNFGTSLTIASGSYIQFINSPVDNPNLNIRATKRLQRTSSLTTQQIAVNDLIVGAELRGTFRHPKISFFSIPSTLSQADIISYLVLGSSSQSATSADTGALLKAAGALGGAGAGVGGAISEIKQGLGLSELGFESETVINAIGTPIEKQTSFVIGKHLTKNIYIRYSYGLGQGPFVPVNIFQVRYRINDHWSVLSSSSTLGSGADVVYTIETK